MAESKGCNSHGMNIGGKFNFEFGSVKVTQAIHSAGIEGGVACGFIIDFYGKTIYFAGDTALFGDIELIGRMNNIDYALLPIGDNFTMGPEEALEAVKMLKPNVVIPIHYDTWPPIAQSPQDFKIEVEKNCDAKVLIVDFNESIEI
ncbi:MAG: metal-dependent hydrolase, partial [Romboutsia timonensis]